MGGRDKHCEVGTHPLGRTDLRLSICKEPLPYREAQREWRAHFLLPAERPLGWTHVGIPVRKDLEHVLRDLIHTCASSPFHDGRRVQLDQVTSTNSILGRAVGKYSPPMLLEDPKLQGEYDGIDAPKDSGEGAIHPY